MNRQDGEQDQRQNHRRAGTAQHHAAEENGRAQHQKNGGENVQRVNPPQFGRVTVQRVIGQIQGHHQGSGAGHNSQRTVLPKVSRHERQCQCGPIPDPNDQQCVGRSEKNSIQLLGLTVRGRVKEDHEDDRQTKENPRQADHPTPVLRFQLPKEHEGYDRQQQNDRVELLPRPDEIIPHLLHESK